MWRACVWFQINRAHPFSPLSFTPQVPGVGPRTAEAFAEKGISSTYQLIGWALMQQDGKLDQAQIADNVFDFVQSEKDGSVRLKRRSGKITLHGPPLFGLAATAS